MPCVSGVLSGLFWFAAQVHTKQLYQVSLNKSDDTTTPFSVPRTESEEGRAISSSSNTSSSSSSSQGRGPVKAQLSRIQH